MGAPDKAQLSQWLFEARTRKKLTRRAVSVALDVTEKSVMRWEDPEDTPVPPADKFLAMVGLYGAAKDLLKLAGNWEPAKRPTAGGGAGEGTRRTG